MKQFKYLAISDTPADQHVHCTRVKAGETYLIRKTKDPQFVAITGYLYDKDGGREKVFDKNLIVSRVKDHVVLFDEKAIVDRLVRNSDSKLVISSTWNQYCNKKKGEKIRFAAGAPGIGYIEYVITRITEISIFGVVVANTVQVPDIEFYR